MLPERFSILVALETRNPSNSGFRTLAHYAIRSWICCVKVFCVFNACVSLQEGLLKGIREESWNKHQDLENHCGLFSEELTQPFQEE